jgi:hypothetical protein
MLRTLRTRVSFSHFFIKLHGYWTTTHFVIFHLFILKWTWWTPAMICFFWAPFVSISECLLPAHVCQADCFQLMRTRVQSGYHFIWKSAYISWMMCHIIRNSLGTAERTVSKSSGLHTVVQSGRESISRTSLMVNAACNGPRRPISLTRRTLLRDSISRACSVMSVFCKKTTLNSELHIPKEIGSPIVKPQHILKHLFHP